MSTVMLLAMVIGSSGCEVGDGGAAATGGAPTGGGSAPETAADPWFTDIASETGLDFVHDAGATGQWFMPEIMGAGCALLDYDGDGDLDVYAVQGFPLAPIADRPGEWTPGETGAGVGINRLYRNDLTFDDHGRPRVRFTDVTDQAGVGDHGYGMGVATGDYDADGRTDLLVTNFGPNALYRNRGDGTFERIDAGDISRDDAWSSSATFFDGDNDGDLDLYIANYLRFSMRDNPPCYIAGGMRDYCGPQVFEPAPDQLLRNDGGVFTDVTHEAGIDRAVGSGLGVVAGDYNADGWMDLLVANDGNANLLWLNNGDGTFTDRALYAGAAYNADGMAEAGMGATAGDFDADGDEDLFLSHLVGETNTLLVNDGRAIFDDHTDASGLGAVSRPFTGFGTRWVDLDRDGWLDLFIANGAVKIEETRLEEAFAYAQPNIVLRNGGPPQFRFEDVSPVAGESVTRPLVSRGAAFGDVDNDGDTDILVSNTNGPLQMLRNDISSASRAAHALRLRVLDARGLDAIGALVRVQPAADQNGPVQQWRVGSDGSYLSASGPRVIFGLGDDASPRDVVVRWRSGRVERFADVPADEWRVVREGEGEAVE